MSYLAAASLGLGVAGGIASGISSFQQSKKYTRKQKEYERMLADLEANRQEVINPYENITNPYENLGVATGAARFQAAETDISLANTLDTIRSSGYSAGGATALAQAALRSKIGIANQIEQQEVRNQELRAAGQQRMEQLQGYGREFKFRAQEDRENRLLSRYAGLSQEAERIAMASRQNAFQSFSSVGGNLMNTGAGYFTGLNQ